MNRITNRTDWNAARAALLAEEKQATLALDQAAISRRKLPWVPIGQPYAFVGPDGALGLADLFAGRSQLITYHHMLRASDPAPCPGCGMVGDQVPHLAHLHARDTSFVMVSRAPYAEIAAFRARMGWSFPWVETTDDFNLDVGQSRHGPGHSVFIRQGGAIHQTYATTARGSETLASVWGLLDMTPMGRQETWQEAPEWVPQTAPYQWWRLHDEYAAT